MIEMQGSGQSSYPVEMPELSSVLTWRSKTASISLMMDELQLVKAIGRVVWLASKCCSEPTDALAAELKLDLNSPLLRPVKHVPNDVKASIPQLLYELQKVVSLVEGLTLFSADIAACARRYKLSVELMAPRNVSSMAKKNELELQRELLRFLIEQGFHATGTKLGRYETDLVYADRARSYVLEVKLIKRGGSGLCSTIETAFAQLASYMDAQQMTPYGILVVFNFSSVQINAPSSWFHDRYLVVVINLQQEAPSGRKRCIEVSEGNSKGIAVNNLAVPRKVGRVTKARRSK